ncbi:hypothetical protein [Mesorhizobium sp. M1399]|uniref:hypothetical protein n=1 Tax=Mesorhizobium sp. M1399 TaxID=2957096 RepID=UPI00333B7924
MKWIGPPNEPILRVDTGIHAPTIKGVAFDGNHLASYGVHLNAGAGGAIQMPFLEDLNFRGYRKAGLCLGADDTGVSRNGQFHHITAMRLSFWGGASIEGVNSQTVTITAAVPSIVSWPEHGRSAGEPVVFANEGGALPSPLVPGRTYWISPADLSSNGFAVASTIGGPAIVTTTVGSGKHTAQFATATGVVLNAQNAEILTAIGFYFDPFTAVGGGPYTPHKNHFRILGGDLNVPGGFVSTRAIDWAIDCTGAATSLNVQHWKSEDIRLVNLPNTMTASGSNILSGIHHRSGHASGVEDVVSVNYQGDFPTLIQSSILRGNIRIGALVHKQVRLKEIEYHAGTSDIMGSTLLSGPYLAKLDVEAEVGIRRVWNSSALEEWRDSSSRLLFKNDRGSLSKIKSIGGSGIKGENLGGTLVVDGASSTATVVFPTAEPDANYRLVITPLDLSGKPSIGSNRVLFVERSTEKFTVTVEAAPGAGSSVEFSWLLFR